MTGCSPVGSDRGFGPADSDIVVVTHNSGARILRCVRCLLDAGGRRIVVVDNASTDGTPALVRGEFPAADFPDVTVVELPANVGFGGAVNTGARLGTAGALVLVNDDAYVEPVFLRAITEPFHRDKRCGMVAGLLTIPGTNMIDSFGVDVDQRLAAWSRGRHQPVGATLGKISLPSGGAVAYRRTAFDAAGGFDERLFAYWEDIDLGLRLARAGWTCAEAPAAVGDHEGGASFKPGSPFQRRVSSFGRGFVLRRFLPHRPVDLVSLVVFEALHVAVLIAAMRSIVPFRERVRGWKAAGPRLGPAPDDVVVRLRLIDAVRRLARLSRS